MREYNEIIFRKEVRDRLRWISNVVCFLVGLQLTAIITMILSLATNR